ncbi:Thioesterase domain protein [compost metagenome]
MNVNKKVNLYMLAGVATSDDFLDGVCEELCQRYKNLGWQVNAQILHPYGNWSRRIRKQIFEVHQDMRLSKSWKKSSSRGRQVTDAIKASYTDGQIVLIGHSAGGIVGIHAAVLLHQEGLEVHKLVEIGAPKSYVPPQLQDRVLYVYTSKRNNRATDPITRIGSWGGWERNSQGLPRWNNKKFAPSHICPIQLIGKHADYFRGRVPYVNETGHSNLDITMTCVWPWLME